MRTARMNKWENAFIQLLYSCITAEIILIFSCLLFLYSHGCSRHTERDNSAEQTGTKTDSKTDCRTRMIKKEKRLKKREKRKQRTTDSKCQVRITYTRYQFACCRMEWSPMLMPANEHNTRQQNDNKHCGQQPWTSKQYQLPTDDHYLLQRWRAGHPSPDLVRGDPDAIG